MKFIKNYQQKRYWKKRSKLIRDITELKFAIAGYFLWNIGDMKTFFNYCQITNIMKKKNIYYVTVKRPGVFIGRKGSVINGIREYLDEEYVKIIEDSQRALIDNILYSEI